MSEKQWKSAVDGKDLSRLPEPVQSAMNRLDTYLDLRLLGKDWETVVDALLAAHAQAQQADSAAFTGFEYNRNGGLTVDRDALHESPGYKKQVAALKDIRAHAQAQEPPLTASMMTPAQLAQLAQAQTELGKCCHGDMRSKGDCASCAAWTAAQASAAEPVAWEYQHGETGVCTVLINDGLMTCEKFEQLNPRHHYVGPLYRHPPASSSTTG